MPSSLKNRATGAGLIALSLWSCLAVLTSATGTMPPFLTVALSFGPAALIGFAFQAAQGRNPLARLCRSPGAWALSVGGLFGYHALYFLALKRAPAVEANLINYLWPLLIVLFSGLLPGAPLKARHAAGAFLGFAGAAWLIAGRGLAEISVQNLPGYAAALACAIVWAAYSVVNRRFAHVPTDAVAGFCAVSALLSGLCHWAFEPGFTPSAAQWAAVTAMGLGPAGPAFFAWDYAVKHGDVRLLGLVAYGVPLASTVLLIAFGNGAFSPRIAVAAALIIGGAVLGAAQRRPRPISGNTAP